MCGKFEIILNLLVTPRALLGNGMSLGVLLWLPCACGDYFEPRHDNIKYHLETCHRQWPRVCYYQGEYLCTPPGVREYRFFPHCVQTSQHSHTTTQEYISLSLVWTDLFFSLSLVLTNTVSPVAMVRLIGYSACFPDKNQTCQRPGTIATHGTSCLTDKKDQYPSVLRGTQIQRPCVPNFSSPPLRPFLGLLPASNRLLCSTLERSRFTRWRG